MNSPANDGYSLLELLVALALTALIAALMSEVIPQLHPLRQIQAKNDAQKTVDRLADVVAQDIGSALELPLAGSDTFQPMIGNPQSIRFLAVVRTGFATEGLREVSYGMRSSPNGTGALVRKTALRRFAREPSATTSTDDELYGISQIRFEYLNRNIPDRSEWQETWTVPRKLPGAIRITLAIGSVEETRTIAFRGE